MSDPFAPYEPPAEPVQEAPKVARPAPATTEGKVTVTLKAGTGFDSPWIVIHAADVAEALSHFMPPGQADLVTLMDRVKTAGAHFAGTGAQRPASGQQPAAPSQQSAPSKPAYQQAPGGQSKYCQHGEMTFRSGTSKAGKVYKGFFCPERDRDAQCKAEFI